MDSGAALAGERSRDPDERAVGRLGGLAPAGFAGLCCCAPRLLPLGEGAAVVGLVWIALIVLPAGCLAGGLARRGWAALGGVLLGAWILALAGGPAVESGGGGAAGLAAGLSGLVLIGFGFGRGSGARAPRLAVALAALALAMELAPRGFLLAERPPASADPALGRLLFDAAPSTWVLEAAGVDWLRHPSNYEPAGTDWFSGARVPFRAGLAGGSLLVLGCVTAAAGCALHRRSTRGAR